MNHFPTSAGLCCAQPVIPSVLFLNLFPGYGVELQIKSSEYKAQDDRKVQAEGESGEDLADEHVTFYFIQDQLRLSVRIAVLVVGDNILKLNTVTI